jgi:hypothetical protein
VFSKEIAADFMVAVGFSFNLSVNSFWLGEDMDRFFFFKKKKENAWSERMSFVDFEQQKTVKLWANIFLFVPFWFVNEYYGWFFFDSVWFLLKKITKPKLKKTETGLNQPVAVRFGFKIKTGSNQFGLVFAGLAWFFSVWVRFF